MQYATFVDLYKHHFVTCIHCEIHRSIAAPTVYVLRLYFASHQEGGILLAPVVLLFTKGFPALLYMVKNLPNSVVT
jgi:hypothetical protein